MAPNTKLLSAFFVVLLCIAKSGEAQSCSLANIGISQTKTGKLVNNLDEYEVVISNNCICVQSSVMLKCTGFNGGENVDQKLFKFVGNNLCSVNDGQPLSKGFPVTFKYAWTAPQLFLPASSVISC